MKTQPKPGICVMNPTAICNNCGTPSYEDPPLVCFNCQTMKNAPAIVSDDMAKEIAQLKADKAELVEGLTALHGHCLEYFELGSVGGKESELKTRIEQLIAKHS